MRLLPLLLSSEMPARHTDTLMHNRRNKWGWLCGGKCKCNIFEHVVMLLSPINAVAQKTQMTIHAAMFMNGIAAPRSVLRCCCLYECVGAAVMSLFTPFSAFTRHREQTAPRAFAFRHMPPFKSTRARAPSAIEMTFMARGAMIYAAARFCRATQRRA